MRFVDKETVANALAASHDVHLLAIDTSEDNVVSQSNTSKDKVSTYLLPSLSQFILFSFYRPFKRRNFLDLVVDIKKLPICSTIYVKNCTTWRTKKQSYIFFLYTHIYFFK